MPRGFRQKGVEMFCEIHGKWKKKVIVNKMNFIYLDVILDFSWLVTYSFFFFKLSFITSDVILSL